MAAPFVVPPVILVAAKGGDVAALCWASWLLLTEARTSQGTLAEMGTTQGHQLFMP
jgi:hypothetical protein